MTRLYRYESCDPKYIEHPYNLGHLYSNNSNKKDIINDWVNQQREYIQNLSLEEKCSILLWIKHPEIYIDNLEAINLVIKSKYHEIHPDEDLPTPEQLSKYILLLRQLIRKAPILSFDVQLFNNNVNNDNGNNGNNNFYELSFEPINAYSSFENIEEGKPCLYIGSLYSNDILFINNDVNENNNVSDNVIENNEEIVPLSNDEIYLSNAIKETLEESNINISETGNIEGYVDFPLYLQLPYIDQTNGLKYFKISTVHGTCASGSTILCRDDKTILCFIRQGKDFNSTLAGVGGSIGESDTKVFNSKFNYRSYIVNVNKEEKEYINETIKLNHESLLAAWLSLDEMIDQVASLNNGNGDGYNNNDSIDKYIVNLPTPISYNDCISIFQKGTQQNKIFIYMGINTNDIVKGKRDDEGDDERDGENNRNEGNDNYYLAIPSLSYIINNLF